MRVRIFREMVSVTRPLDDEKGSSGRGVYYRRVDNVIPRFGVCVYARARTCVCVCVIYRVLVTSPIHFFFFF